MSDMGAGFEVTKMGASMALNSLTPALFTLGPITFGIGTVVGLIVSLIMGGGAKPSRKLIAHTFSDLTQTDDGEPILSADATPLDKWFAGLCSQYVKISTYLSDRDLDVNDMAVSIELERYSDGLWQIWVRSDFNVTGTPFTFWRAGTPFDSNGVMYMFLYGALKASNSDFPAYIRNILNEPGVTFKEAIDNALAARKIELAARAADLKAVKLEIAHLDADHKRLLSLQDADLYQQELDYMDYRAQALAAELADEESALQRANDAVMMSQLTAQRAAVKTVMESPVPWLFLLSALA